MGILFEVLRIGYNQSTVGLANHSSMILTKPTPITTEKEQQLCTCQRMGGGGQVIIQGKLTTAILSDITNGRNIDLLGGYSDSGS